MQPQTPSGARRSVHFLDAIGDWVACSGDEISGDQREIGTQIVGHIDGAADLQARHEAAQMNVADLHNLHALKRGRQIGKWDFDFAYLIVEPLRCEAIDRGKKRRSTGKRGGRLEKITARGIGDEFHRGRRRRVRESPLPEQQQLGKALDWF